VNPKHKTIICQPHLFDDEYDKWVKSLGLLSYQTMQKIDIKHDGNFHYILYVIAGELSRKY